MKCIIPNCRNIAEYNYEYHYRSEYCAKHKNNQMSYKNHICVIL